MSCEFHDADETCVHCLDDEVDRLRKVEEQARASLSDRMDELAELRMETERLREAGDKLAQAVQERWSGDGRCGCDCCTAARRWEAARR